MCQTDWTKGARRAISFLGASVRALELADRVGKTPSRTGGGPPLGEILSQRRGALPTGTRCHLDWQLPWFSVVVPSSPQAEGELQGQADPKGSLHLLGICLEDGKMVGADSPQ